MPPDSDIIALALREDIGCGDVTSEYFASQEIRAEGRIVAREPCIVAGLAVAEEVLPLTRAEVNKAWAQAAADGTLRKNDYDYDAYDF